MARHVVTTVHRPGPPPTYTPECSCGWHGLGRSGWSRANKDADAHRRDPRPLPVLDDLMRQTFGGGR